MDNSSVWSDTLGEGKNANIAIDIGSLSLTNGADIGSKSWGSGNGGTITITANDAITVSGKSHINLSSEGTGDGGSLFITVPNLSLDDSRIDAATDGEGKGGNIDINVGSLSLTKETYIGSKSWGAGNGGEITLTASEVITVSEHSLVTVSTWRGSSGNGGSLLITAPALSLDKSWIDGETLGEGKGGDITVDVGSLTLNNGADISSDAWDIGNGGTITIAASEAINVSGKSRINISSEGTGDGGSLFITVPNLSLNDSWIDGATDGEGKGGDITIDVGSLDITNGGDIFSDAWDIGNGGTITIAANEVITISGEESEISVFTYDRGDGGNILITTPDLDLDGCWIWGTTAGEGKGGNITIDVGSLNLTSGANIASNAFNVGNAGKITMSASDTITFSGNSSVSVSTVGSGDGGQILITTPALDLDKSSIKGATLAEGKGGSVQVRARKIKLINGSTISAESSSAGLNITKDPEAGKSGNIVILVDDTLQLDNSSSITVETAQANAGDIMVNAGFLVHLRDESAITTSVAGGEGDGGNIIIDAIFVVMDGESKVVANAKEGSGGNIHIGIDGDGAFLKSTDSVVDASSKFGVSGSVTIDAPDTDISGSISTLPVSFLDASSLLSERCVTRTAGELSTFIIVGHGGMPLSPDAPLPAYYLLDKPKDQQDNSSFNKQEEPLPKQTTSKEVFVPFDINCCQ
ncbi:S-layer family protein [Desulfobacula toluolica]|uniref:S-layer family protein n=1 Tax=Desulfobacula toluolica TaxID=28223 RepID=UPI0011D2155C|nr:S-layer family protein [Desulfobacula toluolica]